MADQASDEQPKPKQATPAAPGKVFIRDGFLWDRQDAYLFDIDGTLLRSHDRVHFNSFSHSVKRVMGQELVLEGVSIHGSTDTAILRDAFKASNIDEAEWKPQLEPVLELMRTTVSEQRDSLRPYLMPGVEATLRHLKNEGALLGVATGNLEVIGWLKIEAAGLKEWFQFGGFSDTFPVRADMVGHAAELARHIAGPQAKVCVVGDTPWDISAAKANSLPTIAVATGHYSFEELMQHHPEACTTSLLELQNTLAARTAESV